MHICKNIVSGYVNLTFEIAYNITLECIIPTVLISFCNSGYCEKSLTVKILAKNYWFRN